MQPQIIDLTYAPNPLQGKYRAHKNLEIVAILHFNDESYQRKFFRTKEEMIIWFCRSYANMLH
jgi:hypothetical protein